ncbi:CCR4-Not complex component, Not1-domain-containing protein [Lasiosphaeria miniovina]|uniref:General negative regulator of transcription subunit 1 n=1 Tax=Lasiosphaeria miniovina TaxID=1954250 RepID=A0AA40A5C6_9PEZI|nr:CCR4-Not complex component, Not1-domain-containing protein [Lasiosphaeria miniovina]KAK0709555.1 CCR4-Not complex component, Not1-domain-containing protein [Lasiosphaeria miniovina]
MVSQPRSGSFSPNPAAHPIHTGLAHSPHPSHHGALSAAASPSTSSPTGSSSLTKIAVAQVYLLLSTIKEDKDDPHKWDVQAESLRKLIDEHGMDVFSRYFTRLVVANASQIFPSPNRPVANPGNYHLLIAEMRKLLLEFSQSRMVAESIETGTEDIFRDFDLSTFMEHFKLDALEKTVLALAFKLGPRSELKTKADAILSTNFSSFLNLLSQPAGDHSDLPNDFIAELLDRFIQAHPPNFNAVAKRELEHRVQSRYSQSQGGKPPPSEVLAALDLVRLLADKPPNALALYMHRSGPEFTANEETCLAYLQNRPAPIQLNEEQVSIALMYATISQTPRHNPSALVAALMRILPSGFRWQDVVSYFDHGGARITSAQFLRLYNALLQVARADSEHLNIQRLWGGEWENPETQLSFICAFASLKPEQLDATTIPGLKPTFTVAEYAQSHASIQEKAAHAVKHPLVSEAALSAVFNVALHSSHASTSIEAERLFQDVVVPNLPIFVVSAFGVPKPWPEMAEETLSTLFDGFLARSEDSDFVMDSLWRRDKEWVKQRLIDAHALKPITLPLIFDHAMRQNWLDELVYLPNGFGLDLAALAHAEGYLDLQQWARRNAERGTEIARALLRFLVIKGTQEMEFQRPPEGQSPVKTSTTLHVTTVLALLQILEEFLPKTPVPELIMVQRQCITSYPRLINYGEGFDDIILANARNGNALPPAANAKMEEHYKKMYGDEMQVRNVVEVLEQYKHSRDPLEQDVFACMIHGLFEEYVHYVDYPLEALATTAVLFGGIISHKLVSDLPLQIGLGMILEAVRDHNPEESMYKFGLQALIQLFGRLREWPGFCKQLLQIPGLQGTEAWKTAEEVVREHEESLLRSRNGGNGTHSVLISNDKLSNGNLDEALALEQHPPPFASINVDPPPPGVMFENPSSDAQGKIQFVLNNLTDTTLQSMFKELREMLESKHQQWFASHLVEERAKMQPNYHHVYLDLVKQFEDRALWGKVLRETYVSVSRMLNSELTLQNTTERTHLKNLGGWLGLLTLARDKPIKQKNVAFKQLLIEAHDTKRLIVVIPFVCKVLIQGASSNIFRPPNPWLMEIIHLLIELYHNAELKLNLKFEIEVLCKGLSLDHKNIEPSGEILNRVPIEEVADSIGQESLDAFENLPLNRMPSAANTLITHTLPSIPDLGPGLTVPATEVVSPVKLREIILGSLTAALEDIIQPVVDRSVTIAAISTQQMIHKDFATEPDENRVRNAAINMVKSTAGNLALVTSKEPLRANFTNHLRNFSSDLPQGLPEGIIMLCVNSNLDLASDVIEKSAQERAVPEIEEMIENEMEARRRHRLQRPNDPFIDPTLSRWAMTIPHPFKLNPNINGLNAEQMAIYDDFARQPRVTAAPALISHIPSSSDVRSLANEVLGDQYNSVSSLPTPAETPAMPHLSVQLQHYPQANSGAAANGRQTSLNQVDARNVVERVAKLLEQLAAAATGCQEEHFADLPRSHAVLDIIDALVQLIIKTQQTSEDFASYAATQISQLLFRQPEDSLSLECLVHVLETLRKIAGPATSQQIRTVFHQHPGQLFLNLPLIAALLGTDLLDWRSIDAAMAKALQQRKDGSVEFLEQLMDITLLSESPLALYADFVQSLEAAWDWITEEPDVPAGQRFKAKILAPPPDLPAHLTQEEVTAIQQDQMDYVFDEWVQLCNNPQASGQAAKIFVQQLGSRRVVNSKDDLFIFARQALDKSVDRYEQVVHSGGSFTEGYQSVDALVKMLVIFLKSLPDGTDGRSSRAAFVDSTLALGILVLNSHHVKRGELFNQRVFFRFFSILLHEVGAILDQVPDVDHDRIFLKFAARLSDLRPSLYPGFVFGWTALLSHRVFLPEILQLPQDAGWAPFTKLLAQLLSYLGDMLKPLEVSALAKDIYQAALKLLVILQHDFPEYLAANHLELCQSLPPHATQLINMILVASPASAAKSADPFQPGLKVDRIPNVREAPLNSYDFVGLLRQIGLYDILEQTLQNGPAEDAIAQISHAINRTEGDDSTFGYVPINVNRHVIDAVVAYIGASAVNRATSKSDPTVFVPGASEIRTLYMLVTELSPEARYYLISSMVNELRFPNASTHYFSQAILDIFGHDMSDPEETDIRQQIVRVLLERLVGFWPQPWGLMITVLELIKNDKYIFFDLPFIKAAPDVAEHFAAVLTSSV